jgi:ADP-ribose pyrophosphatase
MNFKLTNSKILFEGKVFNLKVDEIEYDSGNKGIREVAVHPGGAVVIPVTDEGKLIMVTQFRYPFQSTLLEFPAGKLDIDEVPLDCAARELEEETGYKAAKVNELGKIYTAPGYCTETLHIYVAQELKEGDHRREEGEYGMEIYEFDIAEIEAKILSGEIIDAKTICAVYLLKSKITS